MPFPALLYVITVYVMGIVFIADIGDFGTKMLAPTKEKPVSSRLHARLPSWTTRAFGVVPHLGHGIDLHPSHPYVSRR